MSGKTGRRLWHLFGGSFFPTLAFFVPEKTVLISLSAVTFAFLSLEAIRLLSPRVNDWFLHRFGGMLKEEEKTRPIASSYLLIGSLAAFLLFGWDIAIASVFFLAVGDPVAATIGERFGTKRIFGRSLEGALACLLICLAIGMLLTIWLEITPLLVLAGAAIVAMIEILPLPIDDNLLIPLLCGGVMNSIWLCHG
jgi:dolichol kinase